MPRGKKTALTICLTAEERQTLQAWQYSRTVPVRRATRGRILLLLADRVPISDIADTVGITRHSVYKWAERFGQYGLGGLADKPDRSRRP
jgi:hypothetical protein